MIKRFLDDECGAISVEWVMLGAFLVAMGIGIASQLRINDPYADLDELNFFYAMAEREFFESQGMAFDEGGIIASLVHKIRFNIIKLKACTPGMRLDNSYDFGSDPGFRDAYC